MTKKLYVGNLSYDTTERALTEMFGALGAVQSVALIMDRETGRSKGFAFVEMPDDAQAAEAVSRLNGKELDGRAIAVSEARPRSEGGGPRGGGFRSGGRGGGRSGGGTNPKRRTNPLRERW